MNQNKKKQIQKTKPQKFQVKKKITDTAKISKQQFLLLFCLLVVVLIAYLPALNKGFTNWDDDAYIIQNPNIANFSFSKIPAIFSHFLIGQYSPIPSVIYGIIHLMVGFSPFLYNFFAVVLHLITIMLVFKLIWSLCSNFRIAFITAALFGIATLQVESVAWLAAVYKTCLYSIFFLSSLIIYVKYIKTNQQKYLVISLLLFIISCFCREEQAVALALAVVAIDIFSGRKLFSKKVIIEKIPFFFISVVFGLITMAAAKSYSHQINVSSFSFIDSVIFISYALCGYIYKLFIPLNLSTFYPYFSLDNSRLLYMIFPLIILILVGLYVYAIKKNYKYIIFGGFFFFLNILFSLASQVIAVRGAVMADRYVYLASIGVFFIVAKGADILIEKKLMKLPVIAVFFTIFFLVTANLTYSRTKIWKDSMTLWNDVISKYEADVAYYNRGILKDNISDFKGAIEDYSKAISISPNYSEAYNNKGLAEAHEGDKGAINDYDKAIEINPKYAEAYDNRGNFKARTGDNAGAIKDYDKSISLNPNNAETYSNKGATMITIGNYREAITDLNKAIELNPKFIKAYCNRAVAKYNLYDLNGAIDDCEKALKINPDDEAANNLYKRIKITGRIKKIK